LARNNPVTAVSRLIEAGWGHEQAEKIVAKAIQSTDRTIAVFDHDNTLVCADVTEGNAGIQPGLGELMILNRRTRTPAPAPAGTSFDAPDELMAYYHQWTKREPQIAYPWITTVLGGYTEEEALEIAERYYSRYIVPRIFPEMQALIAVLQDLGVEVFIVSASCQWFVRPAPRVFGIPEDHVHGIKLAQRGNVILPRPVPPISFAAGKTTYIQRYMGHYPPGNILVFGDSLRTDGHMLRFGARQGGLSLLVNPSPEALKILQRDGIDSYTLPSLSRLKGLKTP